MSREIKFRAWIINDVTREVRPLYVDIYKDAIEGVNRNTIVEQYTGLKDMNGEEIYEGDIVKWKDGKGSVFYEEELARYSVYSKHGGISPLVGKKTRRHLTYEVIGNIHKEEE